MRLSADRGGMSRLGADGLLLITAFLWGVTFVAQKEAAVLTSADGLRRGALHSLGGCAGALRDLGVPAVAGAPRSDELRLAVIIGLTLFIGTSLQQAGIETTSATNAGFLTACYVVLTPFVVWALSGKAPRALVVVAGFVSLFGAWLLASGGGMSRPSVGDGLVLIADFAWATGIALTPIYLARSRRPLMLALVQYAVAPCLRRCGPVRSRLSKWVGSPMRAA